MKEILSMKMNGFFGRVLFAAGAAFALCVATDSSAYGQYKPETILKQRPTQEVEVDYPEANEVENCEVKTFKEGNYQGVALYKPDGTTLLRVWCAPPAAKGEKATVEQIRFFKDGQEVYRDVLGKEARWLNVGGSRRGALGADKKTLESWISISPEEATAEIVAALATNDFARFQRVAATAADVKTLGFEGARASEISAQIKAADAANFAKLSQTLQIPKTARWGAFNGATPATIPAGSDGLKADLVVYYNANVVVLDGAESQQLYIGDLVKIGDVWKIIGLPAGETFGKSTGEVSASSILFPTGAAPGAVADPTGEMGELGAELTDAYAKLESASPEDYPALCEKTIDMLLALAAKNPAEEANFATQAADLAFQGAQAGLYPKGAEKLASIADAYKDSGNEEVKARIRYRQIAADFYAVANAPRPKPADLTKAQEKYAEDLASFAEEYAATEAGAEAMMSLALDQEYMLDNEAAAGYYSQISQNFGGSAVGKKAAGALARLQSEGGALKLPAMKYSDGSACNFAPAGGKPVAIFCWASWDAENLAAMKTLVAGGAVTAIGVNLDGCPDPNASPEERAAFFKELTAGLPWKNVCDPEGLNGPAAVALGVQNSPWIILIDKSGKVVRSNITSVEDLESIVKELK
ncbi:MAG: hypothetical protein HUK22_00020 [Thermoguttaceae bacterium]|nr:hypothetical protein [Thermoguttaceae bacterium]